MRMRSLFVCFNPAPRAHALRAALANRLCDMPQDRNGGVAIMFALMLVAFCMFAGAAVDLGRWAQARSQTIAAMDAAVLAGGRMLQFDDKNVSGAREVALQFYKENTKQRAEVVDDTIGFDPTDDKLAFVSKGNAYIKTTFLNFANIPKLALLNSSKSEYARAEIANGGQNEHESLEISLMLDVTGSMAGTKIQDLKTAAKDLVNIVISDSIYARPTKVALVPFAEAVRLPSASNSTARGNPAATITTGSGKNAVTYKRTDCVVERTGTEKYTDVAPAADKYVTTLYKANNGSCALRTQEEVFPLSKDKDTLKSRIDALTTSGSTAGHIGTAWAWYTLSPNWNSLWSAQSAASAYSATVSKIAILMTDGEYNLQYASNGVSANANSAANGESSVQAKALCTAMKAKGITVYTVGFALGGNQTAINTLQNCATDASKAYTVNTGSELKQAFREIALKITPLYLSH